VAPSVSELDGWPACAPVNASPTRLPASAHDSGSRWFAIPFSCGSFIRYSLPAFDRRFQGVPGKHAQSLTPFPRPWMEYTAFKA
jgi:hypothetical protein